MMTRYFLHLLMLILGAVVGILIAATLAGAQEVPARPPAVALSVLLGTGGLDMASTLLVARNVHRYEPGRTVENNPALSWMEPKLGIGGTLAVAAVGELALLDAVCHAWCRDHPRRMQALLWGLAATHASLAARNLRSMPVYTRYAERRVQ